MQTVYATHLGLPDVEGSSTGGLDKAVECVDAWTRARFQVSLQPLVSGDIQTKEAALRWTCRTGAAGGLFSLEVDQVNTADASFRWRTHVDVGVEAGAAWLRARLALYSPIEGVISRPRYEVGRPGIVRKIADALDIRVDGWRLGEWRIVEEEAVTAYVAFLLNPARTLPVVALSCQAGGSPFVDAAHLADRLLGIAHVVVVETRAAYAVTDAIGKALSCYLGAIRIYWPGFSPGDDPYHHRAFVGGTLTHLGPDGIRDELFDVIGRMAALSIGVPSLRGRLEAEERAKEAHERHAAIEEARQRVASAPKQEDGGVDAETWKAFTDEYEVAQGRLTELEDELLDAAVEIETLRDERELVAAQALELSKALAFGRATEPRAESVDFERPTSVLEAVEIAAQRFDHLVFLPEAFASAEESQYDDPGRVLADLTTIAAIAGEWSAGDLPSGPHLAFKSRCNGYRKGISDTAMTTYKTDYERPYDGVTVMLGPHIRRGIGAVSAILRIYWYQDNEKQTLVVGHVGRKLRDAGNRN